MNSDAHAAEGLGFVTEYLLAADDWEARQVLNMHLDSLELAASLYKTTADLDDETKTRLASHLADEEIDARLRLLAFADAYTPTPPFLKAYRDGVLPFKLGPTQPHWESGLHLRNMTAVELYDRSQAEGDEGLLDEAIEMWTEACVLYPESEGFSHVAANLANALDDRAQRSGSTDDEWRAFGARMTAINSTPLNDPDLWHLFAGLAESFYRMSLNTKDQHEAREYVLFSQQWFEFALANCPDPVGQAGIHANLADLYAKDHLRAIFYLNSDDIVHALGRKALWHAKRGAGLSPRESRDYARHQMRLGYVLQEIAPIVRRERVRTHMWLEARQAFHNAVDATPKQSAEWPAVVAGYVGCRAKDLSAADFDLLEEAISAGLKVDPVTAIQCAERWPHYARGAGHGEVYPLRVMSMAMDALELLIHAQTFRPDVEARLGRYKELASIAAWAALSHDFPDAVTAAVMLERGRGVLLNLALRGEAHELDKLERIGYAAQVRAYREALAEFSLLSGVASVEGPLAGHRTATSKASYSDIVHARERVASCAADLSSVAGLGSSFQKFEADDLLECANPYPLLYLAAVHDGAFAILITKEGKVDWLRLPFVEMDAIKLSTKLRTAYAARWQDRIRWRTVLGECGKWIQVNIVEPCVTAQLFPHRVALIAAGVLGSLPLQIAALDGSTTGGEGQSLTGVRTICYGAGANSMRVCVDRAARRTELDDAVAVVCANAGDMQLLSHADEEAAVVAAAGFAHSQKLETLSLPDMEDIFSALENASVCHFVCHAQASTQQPLESALFLGEGKVLKLSDLLELHLPRARLVVLSACETAVTGNDLPDEYLGLPMGFVQIGAAGVIASMWSTYDHSTWLLMQRFYQLWRGEELPPPEALSLSQDWLRNLTNAEVAELTGQRPTGVPEEALALWEGLKPYENPEHWAAFIYVGC